MLCESQLAHRLQVPVAAAETITRAFAGRAAPLYIDFPIALR
jgi:hypothetical protein